MAWSLTPPFSQGQQIFLAICPKCTALPSIVASLCLVHYFLLHYKKRLRCRRVYNRLMLGMAGMDLIYGIKTFVSTWPLPEGTAWGAAGTTGTCTMAGFFGQGASLSSALYNGTLTLYFVLTIYFGWTRTNFRRHRWGVEVCVFHAMPLAIGWGTAIATLPLKLMNPIGWSCWIGPWPYDCGVTGQCERGENAKLYRWVFFHAILWATFAFVIVGMAMIYCKILGEERKSHQYSFHGAEQRLSQQSRQPPNPQDNANNDQFNPESSSNALGESVGTSRSVRRSLGNSSISAARSSWRQSRSRDALSRRFASQALFYILAFFLAWIFPMAQFAITNSPGGTLYFPLLAMTTIVNPLQGLFNALIYLRPRYVKYRQRQTQQQRGNESGSRPPQDPAGSSASSRQSFRRLIWRRLSNNFGDGSSVDDRSPQRTNTATQHPPTRWSALVAAVSVQDDDDIFDDADDLEYEVDEEAKGGNKLAAPQEAALDQSDQ